MKLSSGGTTFYSRRMTAADAAEVCRWRYRGRQEIYNTEDSPESVRSFLDGYESLRSASIQMETNMCLPSR